MGTPRKEEQSKGATLLQSEPIVIIGGGPAGLTAAYELVKEGLRPIVLEKADKVGGIARTETHRGYRFDIGGHRFFTKDREVSRLWEEMLKDDFLRVTRLSRINYDGRLIDYPLSPGNAVSSLGIVESMLMLLSYFDAQVRPYAEEETFEQWVSNRMGKRLFKAFFESYTEKVWGIPCNQIQSEWAAQRIRSLSLIGAVSNAFFGTSKEKSLIKSFRYPVLGPGMMWERFGEAIEGQGGEVHLNTEVIRIHHEGRRATRAIAQQASGMLELQGKQFISTMPLRELITRLDPPPPDHVLQAAQQLRYRDFVIVGLILNEAHLFPDNWIYVHNPEVKVARIQNFKNWSTALVPEINKTSIGMEYFCNEGDEIWTMPDTDLIDLAARELVHLGLANSGAVQDGVVFRQCKAYPVYDRNYREHLEVIYSFIVTIDNLQSIGRGGMHRYNNQDHSMRSGILAARKVLGEDVDPWDVKALQSYLEEVQASGSV